MTYFLIGACVITGVCSRLLYVLQGIFGSDNDFKVSRGSFDLLTAAILSDITSYVFGFIAIARLFLYGGL